MFCRAPAAGRGIASWRIASGPPSDNQKRGREPDGLGSDLPVRVIQWGGTLPSRRRFVQGISFASFVALGGNFLGVTSLLLGLDGGVFAGKTKLDVLVPVKGLNRYWDPDLGFGEPYFNIDQGRNGCAEFRYPSRWLADQRLARRAAERIEEENPLDLPSLKKKRRLNQTDPVAAFGPPGGSGEDNISVIVAPASPGFQLRDLGSPVEAGEKLLRERIAPAGSDKSASLVGAVERRDESGNLYYAIEYRVSSPRWARHNLAVFAVRSEKLYTLNAQCSEGKWEELEASFKQSALSFCVF